MPLSFDQSGSGAVSCGPLTLPEVQQLCCDCGFVKAGVAESKPLVLRADTAAFFKTLGVNSLSAFRELFYNSRVAQPKPGQAPPPPAPKKKTAAPAVRALRPRHACQSASLGKTDALAQEASGAKPAYSVPDVKEYASLAESYENLKWRVIPRPGGATMVRRCERRTTAAASIGSHSRGCPLLT